MRDKSKVLAHWKPQGCYLQESKDIAWLVYNLVRKVSQKQGYFLYRLPMFRLWKNTKELIHSWKVFLFKARLFQNKTVIATYEWAIPEQLVTETRIINWVAEWLTRNEEEPRVQACLESSNRPGSDEDTRNDVKQERVPQIPHTEVLGPKMHMLKKEATVSSSFPAVKGRGSGRTSGSRPLIRLLI